METTELSLNSRRWINIDTRPMIFSKSGSQVQIDWNEFHSLLCDEDPWCFGQIFKYLGFNDVSMAVGQHEIFQDILYSSRYIFKKRQEMSLQKITPRQLGFEKDPETGEGVPTFDEFVVRALERGFILCHFYVPLLFCLGTNFRNSGNPEGYRFATPGFRGNRRFEVIRYQDGYVLDAVKVEPTSLVYLDYPHVFLKPNSKQRRKFLESPYCKRTFPRSKNPGLYQIVSEKDLVFANPKSDHS